MIYSKMINFSLQKQLSIILPNTNKALAEVLKSATPKELEILTKGKDLNSVLSSLIQQSTKDSKPDTTLLNLLKNNPTLKELATLSTPFKDLHQALSQEKIPLQLVKVLKNFLSDIQNLGEKDVNAKNVTPQASATLSKAKDLDTLLSTLTKSKDIDPALSTLSKSKNLDAILSTLSKSKDLNTILSAILQQSAKEPTQDATLLNLLKNNPTLKELGTLSATFKDLHQLLSQDKTPLPLEKVLKNFLNDIQHIGEKELKTKIENSGVFLESKIKTQGESPQIKEMFATDLKAVLLKTHEELSNSQHPNKQEILKQIDKLTLQIDYYQLTSHLSNASSLYIPYAWDELEDGNITLKRAKNDRFFCDIELNLKEQGALKLRLGMFEKNQLSINITTQNKEFKALLQENLPELKKQLISVGIMPKEIRFLDDSSVSHAYEESSPHLAMGFEVKV